MTTIPLTSPSFGAGESIPARHTCDGSNLSPALQWSHLPKNAKSLALICDDPDAPGGMWHHWAVYDIPADRTGLKENLRPDDPAMKQASNDSRAIGYSRATIRIDSLLKARGRFRNKPKPA